VSALLEMDKCTLKFGGLTAVNSFEFSINQGELVGLIGPNGAGKTCIFNLLTGIYHPQPGEIRFLGKKISGKKAFRINQLGIARTFQNIRLFNSLTVLENVRMGFHYYLKHGSGEAVFRTRNYYIEEDKIYLECLKLMEIFGLEKFAKEQARHLPYGEQRRLEIVRALATKPKLLLLDEPAAGMNPQEKQELKDLIRWIRKEFDLTILLIEHDMAVVMDLCERIVVLDHGETIARGNPDEVKNNPKVIEAYLGEPLE